MRRAPTYDEVLDEAAKAADARFEVIVSLLDVIREDFRANDLKTAEDTLKRIRQASGEWIAALHTILQVRIDQKELG
jgi:hypothetical protein